jgi:hypothetical protein
MIIWRIIQVSSIMMVMMMRTTSVVIVWTVSGVSVCTDPSTIASTFGTVVPCPTIICSYFINVDGQIKNPLRSVVIIIIMLVLSAVEFIIYIALMTIEFRSTGMLMKLPFPVFPILIE